MRILQRLIIHGLFGILAGNCAGPASAEDLSPISELAILHVKVYAERGRFGGWPANHGIWSWGNEILVGFSAGYHKDLGLERHNIDREKPEEHLLARSLDGGMTWTNIGLKETQTISRIVVHPTNPDIVWVAALGHIYGKNDERGVYKSEDGGLTWKRVLFATNQAGAVDLVVDTKDPKVLIATIWDAWRAPYSLNSGDTSCEQDTS